MPKTQLTLHPPSEWVSGALSNFIEETKERNIRGEDIPVFSVTNTKGFVLQSEQFARSIHSKETTSYKVFRKNEFGYNPARINVGSIALNENHNIGLLSPMYVVFRTKATLNPHFLKYYVQTPEFRNCVVSNTAGSVRESLNFSGLQNFPFQCPKSADEQANIAAILTTIDKAIEQTEALIAKQQRIKTGLIQDLFTNGIDKHGNIRSEATHAFKDSPLGRIPVEWNLRSIRDSAEICNNLRKPLSAQVRQFMQGEYPYYGPTGILDYIDEFRVNGKYVLIGEDGDHFLKFHKQEMTILINGKCNVNNHAHILRGNDEVLTEWIHFFYLHRDITYFLTRQGAGRFKLNKATLLDLPLAAPEFIYEQEWICEIVENCRVSQSRTRDVRRKLLSLRAGLLTDLLSGRKRVSGFLAQDVTQ